MFMYSFHSDCLEMKQRRMYYIVLNYLWKYSSLKKVLIVLYFFFTFILKLMYSHVIQEVKVFVEGNVDWEK